LVEVFVQSDSSNPASPERMKPNKPLFKPPFSKPVFNEFTPNSSKSASQSAKQSPPALTSSTSASSSSHFPSKAKFDAYVSRKGGSYAPGKDGDEAPTGPQARTGAGDAKGVTWADSKGTAGLSEYDSGAGGSSSWVLDEKRAESRRGGGGMVRQESKSGSGSGSGGSAHSAPPVVKENSWLSWGGGEGSGKNSSDKQKQGCVDARRTSGGASDGWLGRPAAAAEGNDSPNYTRL
jgi:hypothetical protein